MINFNDIFSTFDLKPRNVKNFNVVFCSTLDLNMKNFNVVTFDLKPRNLKNFNVALFRQRRDVFGVTALRDADVMRKSVLNEIVERDAEVEAVAELNEAVVAEQVSFRRNRSA